MERGLRYERKYRVDGYTAPEIIQILKFHPFCFSEIFYERHVNNLYFDSSGFKNYYSNVEGQSYRYKFRIRWYGALFGEIEKPVAEIKVKHGHVGNKFSYPLRPFVLNPGVRLDNITSEVMRTLDQLNDKEIERFHVKSLTPVLMNTYTRRYFLSADKKFRVTVDYNQEFYHVHRFLNYFVNKVKLTEKVTVIELKYDLNDDIIAKEFGKYIPFTLTKNSKYIEGIDKILF